ncbi:unnamed protein product [Cylicocyclus nassatus]|uniref:Uncharacterized protein n=1 Tax=Cylicocyclus nassatus TaxID=53992 RepID=A0AA36HC34_CYLNA|nr:unnamed protein product [Cylicocyclus nassatus]
MRPFFLLCIAVVIARTYLPCELRPCPPPGFFPPTPAPGSIVFVVPSNTTTTRTTTTTTATTTRRTTTTPPVATIIIPRTLAPPGSVNPWQPYVWPSGGRVPAGAWPWLVTAAP